MESRLELNETKSDGFGPDIELEELSMEGSSIDANEGEAATLDEELIAGPWLEGVDGVLATSSTVTKTVNQISPSSVVWLVKADVVESVVAPTLDPRLNVGEVSWEL